MGERLDQQRWRGSAGDERLKRVNSCLYQLDRLGEVI